MVDGINIEHGGQKEFDSQSASALSQLGIGRIWHGANLASLPATVAANSRQGLSSLQIDWTANRLGQVRKA
jgi:hypothetical protein